MKIIIQLSRILMGVVFAFSGFVKAIDPLGSTYKFTDYFIAFNMEAFTPVALPLAILLSTLELAIGLALLLGVKMKYTSIGSLLFMLFFTPLTLYIAIFNPVSDCGCFGDALKISNWGTFYKNIVFLAAAIVVFMYRKRFRPLLSENKDWWLAAATIIIGVWISFHCLRNLPWIDFLPWKVGNKISELVTPTPEVAEIYLIFKNKETGETKEYHSSNYPWNDPEWMATWEFVSQRKEITQEFQDAAIKSFSIMDEYGDDYTEAYINNPDYQFILVAYDLNQTNTKAFTKINAFAAEAEAEGHSFIVLTAAPLSVIEAFRHQNQTPYPYYQTDEIELKSMVRANPGLILLKDGVVIAKWAHRNIPLYHKVKSKYMKE